MAFLFHGQDSLYGLLQYPRILNDFVRLQEQVSEQAGDSSQDQEETPTSVPLPPKLSSFYDSGKLSDVSLMVGSSIFHTHKLILSLWSPVFKKMLLKTSKTDEPHVLDDAQEHEVIFPDFLKFMYTETIELSKDTVYSFHKLAKKYEVEEILDLCEEFLIREVSDEIAAVQILNEAEEFGFTKVYEHCFEFLKNNFYHLDVLEMSLLEKLSPSVFLKLLESSDLVVTSESILFHSALDWLTDDKRKNEYLEYTEDVISKIRFAHMSLSQLSTLKSEHSPLVTNDRLNQCLQHSLDDIFQWKALVSCEEELNRIPLGVRSTLFERYCVEPRIYIENQFKDFRDLPLSEYYCKGLDFPVTCVSANNTLSEEIFQWSVSGTSFCDKESETWRVHYWVKPHTKHVNKKYRLAILTRVGFALNSIGLWHSHSVTSKGVVPRQKFKVEQVLHQVKITRLESVQIKVVIMVKMTKSDHLTGLLRSREETDEDWRAKSFLQWKLSHGSWNADLYGDYE